MIKQCNWLRQLCKDIELLTIQHLNHQKSQMSEKILQHIYFCKKHIPLCLRICNTFFTQMIMVGRFNCNKGFIPFHVDSDDFITALFSVGGSTKIDGGSTFYLQKSVFEGKEHTNVSQKISFHIGNLQIGCYDQVLHGANRWNSCMRGVINFSMQKNAQTFLSVWKNPIQNIHQGRISKQTISLCYLCATKNMYHFSS